MISTDDPILNKCPRCDRPMFLDEWNGWLWVCFECEHQVKATNDEILKHEKEVAEQNQVY